MSSQNESKLYKIGQAAKIIGVNSSVLRFWEGEFKQLNPIRTDTGQRLYNEEHIAFITTLQKMLHEEGLTIEGAKKRIEAGEYEDSSYDASMATSNLPLLKHCESSSKQVLREVRDELVEILDLLK